MAMTNEQVKKIESFSVDLGELIKELNPITDKEWDAFAKCVDAHKNLMKIDTDSLRQLGLFGFGEKPKVSKPRKDCPRCKGTGLWVDPDAPEGDARTCNCNAVDKKAWPQVKKGWAELLAPAPA